MRRSTHRSCIGRSWRVDASWRPRDDGFGFEATGADSRDPRVVAFLPEPLAPSRATRAIADARASGALAREELAADPRPAERAAASAARFTERHIPPVAPRAQPHASRDRETLARADCGRPRTGARHPQPRGRTRPPAYLSDAPPAPIEDTPARSRPPDSRATQYAARVWRRPLQPPARCRHQTGGNHRTTRTAPILFLVSAWRAKTRVALRRSLSNLSQKNATDCSCDDEADFSERVLFLGRPKRRVKKSYDFLLHARPRTLDRAEAGCAWRWEGVIDRERWEKRDVRTAGRSACASSALRVLTAG